MLMFGNPDYDNSSYRNAERLGQKMPVGLLSRRRVIELISSRHETSKPLVLCRWVHAAVPIAYAA